MKKTKLVALSIVLALILNMIMPLITVIALSSYTITFTATGTHTLENENGRLKIDGQYVELRNSGDQAIGEVNVNGNSASITVSDGTVGQLNYYSANLFTLYNTDGHTEYTIGTEFSSNAVFMVEDYTNSQPQTNGGFDVQFLENDGSVWYKFGDGAEIELNATTQNIAITTGTMTIRTEDRTIGTALLFINGSQQGADVDDFKQGYTFSVSNTDQVHFEIQYIDEGGSGGQGGNENRKTSGITVTAGNGTYGDNKSYDADIEVCINNERWDHSNTISYDTNNEDTTVTLTFETLWINRFYEDIVINGVSYTVSDYLDFDDRTEWLIANHGTQTLSLEIPNVAKADNYNIVVKNGENLGTKYLATFLWTADPAQADSHDYIGNSKLEFVKAVYSVGNTTYTVTEQSLEGKLVRDGSFLNADSEDGFLRYGINADVDYDDGSLTLPGNADITMRVVPDYGYQVTSVNGGDNFTTTESGVSEFTVTVEEGTAGYFQATVEKVDNTVTPTSEKVKAGNITLGDSASTDIKNGTVRLSVEDVELTSDQITNFEKKASEAGNYEITNYLDINLDKVLYKGNAEDVWSEQIHHLTDNALITLQLEEGVDASNIVIVHNIDNGDEFEIIPIESYDAQTNTISFYTNSFSNYAIANKTSATTDTSSNPTTGDNIIMIISIFAIATFGAFTTLKVNKNRKIRRH